MSCFLSEAPEKYGSLTPVILFLVTLRGQIPVFSGVSDRENDLILTYAYQESVYNGGGPKKQVIIIMTKWRNM